MMSIIYLLDGLSMGHKGQYMEQILILEELTDEYS